MTFVRALTSQRMWQLLVVSALTLGLAQTVEARDTRSRPEIAPAIRYFEPVDGFAASTSLVRRGDRATRQLTVTFQTLGTEFTLDLEPNELFTPNARNTWVGSQVRQQRVNRNVLYKGTVRGQLKSWARVRVRNGMMDGMIWTPEETYFIEPSARFFRGGADGGMVAYRLSDTDSDWSHGSCALDDTRVHQAMQILTHQSGGAAASAELAQVATATLERADIGIVADYDYYLGHGANSASDMQSILNQVDGIYQSEVGVTLQVTKTVVYSTPSDPFSATTDPSTLLNEFSSYSGAAGSPVAGTDLAHLFTGRDLNGGVIGIAWIGSVCSGYYGTGLSQDYTTDNKSLVLLTAHEIGHNFGASHDNQSGSSCASTPFGYIMNPYVSTSLNYQFSDCSKSYILPEIASAACLSSASGTATPTLTPTATPTPTPTPTALPPNAHFVSQISPPTQMTTGQTANVQVVMQNTGGATWTAANNYRLGAQNPWDNNNWGIGSPTNRVVLGGGDSITTGQTKAFNFTVTAPSTPGIYNFQWWMLQEGVTWFGDLSPNVAINVVAAAPASTPSPTPLPRNAHFVSQIPPPTQMTTGQTANVQVVMQNTGGNTWTAAGSYRLGAQNPWDNNNWGIGSPTNRVVLGGGDSITTGQTKAFNFTVTAPSTPGIYNFQWWMLQEGVAWFGDLSPNVAINVVAASPASTPSPTPLPRNAHFVSQISPPTQMTTGQTANVQVVMQNTGGNTWTAAGNYRLGAQNPWDNNNWGIGSPTNRVVLGASDAITTGQTKAFNFTITAPSTPGIYNFQWWMLQEGVTWFGDLSPNVAINVVAAAPASIPTPTPPL